RGRIPGKAQGRVRAPAPVVAKAHRALRLLIGAAEPRAGVALFYEIGRLDRSPSVEPEPAAEGGEIRRRFRRQLGEVDGEGLGEERMLADETAGEGARAEGGDEVP